MKSIHNFSVVEADPAHNFWQNRAFQYGDGLFETIIFRGGAARYLASHYGRLTAGMAVLDLAVPAGFSAGYLAEAISGLVLDNGLGDQARVKVQVWRRPGGLYTPDSREAEFLVGVAPLPGPAPLRRDQVRFYGEMRLHASPLSRFKTCSALPYVLAGLARRRLGADEVILLDGPGHVAECVASNLFWLRNGTLYTPSLATGCVAGIMRDQILAHAGGTVCPLRRGCIRRRNCWGRKPSFAATWPGTSSSRHRRAALRGRRPARVDASAGRPLRVTGASAASIFRF
jgi:branched-chain amino acid aminotransferase/4-amino-4-deoxychorismate lyase